MYGPFFNHIWPSSTLRLARNRILSRLNQLGVWDILLEFLFLHSARAFFGRCWGHACPRLALRLARALKCSGLGHSGVQDKTMACLIPMTMPGPYLDLVWISFTSKLHRALKFWSCINWVQGIYPWSLILWNHAKAMFGPYWKNGWCSFTSKLSQALTIVRLH